MLVIVFRYSVLCFADNDTLALRGNSIATKAVESYMKLVGQKVQALNIFWFSENWKNFVTQLPIYLLVYLQLC